MKDASEEFATSVRNTMEVMLGNAKELERQMGQAIDQTARSLADEFKRVAEHIHSSFTASVDVTLASLKTSVESSLSQVEQQLQGSANRTLGAVEAQVREATDRASSLLQAQLGAMDQAIERELEKVFREMGSALATISRRIADDHATLAQNVGVQ
jgi:phage-related protein